MKGKLVIRPAQLSDKETVFKLCERTFDWGDYVPNVWDEWLEERHSKVLAATLDGELLGIMRVALPKTSEAWFQAARTHPNHRREGIATALAEACSEWARSMGARVVRLSTDSDNYVAQKALDKLGFTRISDFTIMKCEKLELGEAKNCRWAQKSDLGRMWAFLQSSEILRESAGLYTVIFVWMSLGRRDLEEFVVNEKAIVHYRDGALDGLVLVDETVREVWDGNPIQTCYIDGDLQTVLDMMRFLKAYARQQRVTKVYAFACNVPTIVEALAKAGFSRDDPNSEFIYQKALVS